MTRAAARPAAAIAASCCVSCPWRFPITCKQVSDDEMGKIFFVL
jgi:hypothetical protein